METFIITYWQQIIAAIAFIVWLVRLEMKTRELGKEMCELKKENKEDIQELKKDVKALIIAVTKVQSFLEGKGITK